MEFKVGEGFLQLSRMFCGTWTVTMTPYLTGDSRYQNCSHYIKGTNVPQASKHRKRSAVNLSCEKLACHSASLYEVLLSSWINTSTWAVMKEAVKGLASSIDGHISYLRDQSKRMKVHHSTPSESFGDKTNLTYLPRSSKVPGSLRELDQALSQKQVYEYVFVQDFAPADRQTRYHYIQKLHKGLSRPAVLCTHTVGSSIGNYHFVWAIPEHVTLEAALNENVRLLEDIKSQVPVFHGRALKAEFVSKFGRLVRGAPLDTLWEIYRNLTGDSSSSRTSDEKEVDARVQQALEMENPDLLLDLRAHNSSHSNQFSVFWEKLQAFLNDQSTVHERRHGDVAYMAKIISVRDLVQEVTKLGPPETPIPSFQWMRLQFCPRNPRTKVASLYQGRFKV